MNLARKKNLRVVGALVVLIGIMGTLVSYSATLYRLFCAATGLGGTTQRADSDNAAPSDWVVTVRFDTSTAPDLPWRFEPVQRKVRVRLGEPTLVFFSAENLTDRAIVGHATFNVTPEKTGIYFKKIQCFCFDDERLEAHQKVEMPVDFFVDPALANDPNTKEVDAITLSYTFFRSKETGKAKDLSRFVASAEPDPHRGQQFFAERCAACHALANNKAGPMLGGVFGRKAGSHSGIQLLPGAADFGDHLVGGGSGSLARRSPRVHCWSENAGQNSRSRDAEGHHRLSRGTGQQRHYVRRVFRRTGLAAIKLERPNERRGRVGNREG